MPTYEIKDPNGDTYSITAPDGASEADVLAYAQKNFKMAAKPKAKPVGQQLNDAISDVPRQLGLTARAAVQGIGGMADLVTSPIRAGLNAAGMNIKPGMGQALADGLGLPKPKPGLESTVGTAAEFVAGGLVPIGIGGALARNASGVTQKVGRVMASNPGQQLASAGASGLASGHVRETGGSETSQMVAGLAAGIAAPVGLNMAGRVSQKASSAVRRMATPAPSQQQIDITINTALQGGGSQGAGYALADMPPDIAQAVRADVAEAMKLGGNLKPDAVRRLADYRLIGATPNRAGLTLDPGDITRQKNLSKVGANSKDPAAQGLSQMENANNARLTTVLNGMGAGTADDGIAGAGKIMGALENRNERIQGLITGRYNEARASSGRSAELDPDYFVNTANQRLNEAMLGDKVPESVRNILNKEWVDVMRSQPGAPVNGPTQPNPPRFTVDMAEQMKTNIAARQRQSTDPAERAALSMVRSALDETPLQPGQQIGQEAIDAFNSARALNRKWMGIVEKTPALQAVREGAEPDKFVQQFIIGKGPKSNVMDVAKLKSSIKANPDAMQAVREQIAADLKLTAKGGAADEIVNFSQSAYNKRLAAIGDRKLALFFKPDEIAKLKAVGRVASYEQAQPVGSAVNNSNTAGGMSSIIDRIISSPLLGKIPFGRTAIAEPLENIMLGSQVRTTLSAPRALTDGQLTQPSQPLTRGVSPAIFMDTDTEEAKKRRGLLNVYE